MDSRAFELLELQHVGSVVAAYGVGLEHRLSSASTWAQLLCSMWNLLRPGIEVMSPALAGGFFTTDPPGRP